MIFSSTPFTLSQMPCTWWSWWVARRSALSSSVSPRMVVSLPGAGGSEHSLQHNARANRTRYSLSWGNKNTATIKDQRGISSPITVVCSARRCCSSWQAFSSRSSTLIRCCSSFFRRQVVFSWCSRWREPSWCSCSLSWDTCCNWKESRIFVKIMNYFLAQFVETSEEISDNIVHKRHNDSWSPPHDLREWSNEGNFSRTFSDGSSGQIFSPGNTVRSKFLRDSPTIL